jgi:hypothetical protein
MSKKGTDGDEIPRVPLILGFGWEHRACVVTAPSDSHLQPIGEAALWEHVFCWPHPLNPVGQLGFRHASDILEAFGR